MTNLYNIRRDFTLKTLDEKDLNPDPIVLFEQWLNEAILAEALEPNAMCLATATPDGRTSTRIVLLKQLKEIGFVFFTNYDSKKGEQLAANKYCALNFCWHELERQVRIEGSVCKISAKDSDSYFDVRPIKSKLGAWASPQSKKIPNREYLEKLVTDFNFEFKDKMITRPDNWGGYIVQPQLIEFWQGRESRLHDRLQYELIDNNWSISRLAP